MKEERLLNSLSDVKEEYILEAAPEKTKKKRHFFGWAAAACLVLLIGAFALHMGPGRTLSGGARVNYVKNPWLLKLSAARSSNDMMWFTEEELFTNFGTVIFKGTVENIDNIVVFFNLEPEYQALAQIRVEKVYRGELEAGQTITVLLPCPIVDGYWVEDTDVAAQLKEGMTGIFMPVAYTEDSVWIQSNVTLKLRELAEYGFPDGLRFAFLETENGLVFCRDAYESIGDAETLDEIEAYVTAMIEKTTE